VRPAAGQRVVAEVDHQVTVAGQVLSEC